MSDATENNTITAIPGIRVGHCEDRAALRGVTVIRFPEEGAIASVDVRGSAPGTRETDLLDPMATVERIHAIVLAGGSAYGLDAASEVMACLEDENIGYRASALDISIPIVPAAVIFDLFVGDPLIRPTREWGLHACRVASDAPVALGNVGAGLGATVGKTLGLERRMKGGLGSFVMNLPGGIRVGALVIVNAFGDIMDPRTDKIIAGVRGEKKGQFADSIRLFLHNIGPATPQRTNTTIGVVATNARLSKIQLRKVAQMAHNGLARSIRPVHTIFDGDTIFAVSVPGRDIEGDPGRGLMMIAVAAGRVLEEAIRLAVAEAEMVAGIPAARDWEDVGAARQD
uniref:L-aminopeptidase/D-esterase n=1 Tax=Candidatus Kentrum sp. LPFa TaxID=2126335 RepID=A0A450X746_9GAMM|nr:MAG: L-aminopeptidase/D-esterase [Candidatus Kentron sp. LPFa]VFK25164.1 MAG: L-aminopeptidase/D-esterase [Candidatus Kentron sp. LPFa]